MKSLKEFKALTEAYKAVRMKGFKWDSPQGVMSFMAQQPGFGIQNEKGQFLSKDGISPSTWRTKRIVDQMLPYADTFKGYTWVDAHK